MMFFVGMIAIYNSQWKTSFLSIDSTRILYQKKLAILIRGENGVENGHDKSIPNGDEFSADDEEVDQPDVVTRKSTRTRTPKTSSPKKVAQTSPSASGNLRQRFRGNQ